MGYDETPTDWTVMKLFRSRAIQTTTKIVKAPKDQDDAVDIQTELITPETVTQIEESGKRLVKYTALTIFGAVAALKVIDIVGEIAVKKTKDPNEK
jgi:hypothetical protein